MSERVLVLMGGPDAERPVSIASGRAVAAALRAHGAYAVDEAVIDRPDLPALEQLLNATGADVVLPVLHGTWGEGGGLQRLLEATRIPYVGAGPAAAALAMDKMATKQRAEALGIDTPPACIVDPDGACPLDAPLVLKPVDDGSSIDLRICRTDAEIAPARAALHPRRGRLLAERYVDGRELTVGVLLDEVLPVIEIVPAVEYYDYAAKYERSDTAYVLEPDLPLGLTGRIQEWSLDLARDLGARDVARVDFILEDDRAWLLEINTMPGFTDHSLVPKAAAHIGRAMPDLCAALVEAALVRGRTKARA